MGNNIADQRIIKAVTVRGRKFDVERTVWRNSDGLSFDVYDQTTGQLLTNESFDDEPDTAEVSDLLDWLTNEYDEDALDDPQQGGLFDDWESRERLRMTIEATRPPKLISYQCQGCGASFYDGEEDLVLDHVAGCDKVDGAGNPR